MRCVGADGFDFDCCCCCCCSASDVVAEVEVVQGTAADDTDDDDDPAPAPLTFEECSLLVEEKIQSLLVVEGVSIKWKLLLQLLVLKSVLTLLQLQLIASQVIHFIGTGCPLLLVLNLDAPSRCACLELK